MACRMNVIEKQNNDHDSSLLFHILLCNNISKCACVVLSNSLLLGTDEPQDKEIGTLIQHLSNIIVPCCSPLDLRIL